MNPVLEKKAIDMVLSSDTDLITLGMTLLMSNLSAEEIWLKYDSMFYGLPLQGTEFNTAFIHEDYFFWYYGGMITYRGLNELTRVVEMYGCEMIYV